MPSITPSLWFDHNLEDAARFYTSVFPNSHIEGFTRYAEAGPGEPGSVVTGTFVLDSATVDQTKSDNSFISFDIKTTPGTVVTTGAEYSSSVPGTGTPTDPGFTLPAGFVATSAAVSVSP